jgi:hypothetical protein
MKNQTSFGDNGGNSPAAKLSTSQLSAPQLSAPQLSPSGWADKQTFDSFMNIILKMLNDKKKDSEASN